MDFTQFPSPAQDYEMTPSAPRRRLFASTLPDLLPLATVFLPFGEESPHSHLIFSTGPSISFLFFIYRFRVRIIRFQRCVPLPGVSGSPVFQFPRVLPAAFVVVVSPGLRASRKFAFQSLARRLLVASNPGSSAQMFCPYV